MFIQYFKYPFLIFLQYIYLFHYYPLIMLFNTMTDDVTSGDHTDGVTVPGLLHPAHLAPLEAGEVKLEDRVQILLASPAS